MFAEFSNFKIPSYFNVEYSWGRRTIELIDRNLTISRFELGSTQVFRLNKSMSGKVQSFARAMSKIKAPTSVVINIHKTN